MRNRVEIEVRGLNDPRNHDDLGFIFDVSRPFVLGNPFKLIRERDRAKVLELYLDWLRRKYREASPERDLLNALAGKYNSGERIILVCRGNCALNGKPCHAGIVRDAIVKIAKKMRSERNLCIADTQTNKEVQS